jgi:hypothetical protein
MCSVIIASAAALLGTGDYNTSTPSDNTFGGTGAGAVTSYSFERDGIEGGSVELTDAAPTATFLVTIVVNDLGPSGVSTVNGAFARITGAVTKSKDKLTGTDSVTVDLSSPEAAGSTLQATSAINMTQTLQFTGDCNDPKQGTCRARFAVNLARSDAGAGGGALGVDWTFDVVSSGQLPATTGSTVPAQDPPWTVEVTGP